MATARQQAEGGGDPRGGPPGREGPLEELLIFVSVIILFDRVFTTPGDCGVCVYASVYGRERVTEGKGRIFKGIDRTKGAEKQ